MKPVANFILRIYRYDDNEPDKVVGILEDIGADRTRNFHGLEELMGLLKGDLGSRRDKGERK